MFRVPLDAAVGQRDLVTIVAVTPVDVIDATEKRLPRARLVAITHGDPRRAGECGRPVYMRFTRVNEKRSADRVYVCPLHGDLVEIPASGDGYVGAHAFFAEDARPRRKSE